MAKKKAKKNPAAVALGKRRLEKLSQKRRREIASMGGEATRKKLTKAERIAIASKAGKASAKKRALAKSRRAETSP